MKFTLPTAVIALALSASNAAAASIEILATTGPGMIPYSTTTHIGNDGRHTGFGYFTDGCKKNKDADIEQICIDSDERRAHVTYTSGYKRCFKQTSTWSELCGGDEKDICFAGVCNRCWEWTFTEANCDW
ncbi:hypothetical protein OPT61_g4580 [Boeremia exigua]|uniref:Uncharacterized protein n=1 Tax=Boeremia exigua TaxID=749465 RepID=A0ACC2IDL3_9PLEO|nr:hypothetical protein OPT61_g4580 [Boeremia exigua]